MTTSQGTVFSLFEIQLERPQGQPPPVCGSWAETDTCTMIVPARESTLHGKCKSEVQYKKGALPGVPGDLYNYCEGK